MITILNMKRARRALWLLVVLGLVANAATADFTALVAFDAPDANPGDGLCQIAGQFALCTLRAAVMEVNALADPSSRTIHLVPGALYSLTIQGAGEDLGATGDLDLLQPTLIEGNGATIDATGLGDRAFDILNDEDGSFTQLRQLRVTGGTTAEDGGGVRAFTLTGGSVILQNVTLERNHSDGNGGGLEAAGSVLVIESSFVGNSAGGYGGGVAVSSGNVGITRTLIANNHAAVGGGGLAVWTFLPAVNVYASTLSGNSGPWAAMWTTRQSFLGVHWSTVANQQSTNGLDAWIDTVTNFQGVLFEGSCDLGPNASILSLGDNLESPGATCLLVDPTDLVNVADAGLRPLRDNGGHAASHALERWSPALDPIGGALDCLGSDQRLVTRPVDGNNDGIATCDIGSFEAGYLFLDGFESGDVSAWSAVTP